MAAKITWSIDAAESGVFRVRFSGSRHPSMWVLLSADWHWDNPKCRLGILSRDLSLAKKVGAMVISAGDHFCAMQGKFDKRSSKDSVRPEHATGSYLDSLVETAADYLTPYKGNMGLISTGNHETAIYGRHETCLTSRLVERLRANGSPCRRGGYNGWIMFQPTYQGKALCEAYRLYYHHGSGGDSPVTHGTIAMSRVSSFVDADCILSGHLHTRNMSVTSREKLTSQGNRKIYDTTLVRVSTYKDEYRPLEGWHIEKGKGPRPTENPAYWMRLRFDGTGVRATFHDSPEV